MSIDLWENSPDLPLSAFFPSRLMEAKGLPPGWVSVWKVGGKEKKNQKQNDGSWVEVPEDTPLGLQPFHSAGKVGGKKYSADDEMMSYLDSVKFNDPKIQATLLKNPKFVGDALQKFGAGWFDKFKKHSAASGGDPTATPAGTVPPAAAPPSDPVAHALQKLGYAPDSQEGFFVAQLFKYGGSVGAISALSKKYGLPSAIAFEKAEAIWKSAAAKGVIDVTPEDDFDVKVKFKTGGAPVTSAPVVAVTPSVAAPPMTSADADEVEDIVAKLKYKQGSDAALAVIFIKKHKDDLKAAAADLAGATTLSPAVAATVVASIHGQMLNIGAAEPVKAPKKKKAPVVAAPVAAPPVSTPPAVAPPPPPAPPAEPEWTGAEDVKKLYQKLPGIEQAINAALDKAGVYASVDDKQKMLALLWMGSADALHAEKQVKKQFPATGGAFIQALSKAGIYKVQHYIGDDPNGELAGPPFQSDFHIPSVADPTPASSKKLVLPPIPPMSALSDAGQAQTKLGGNKPKRFLKDAAGALFLHKLDAERIRAAGGEVASRIAALVAGPGGFVPVKAVEQDGDWSTVQPMVPDAKQLNTDVTSLSKDQLKQLARERVIDWVVANHDSKPGNFITTPDGTVLGIDKEQAFKFIGQDELSTDYKPNPSEPIHNLLYKAYAAGKLDLDLEDALPAIQAVENTSDEDWEAAIQPYLDALPASKRKEVKQAILDRKHNVRKDFEKFYSELRKQRGEPAFKFPETGPKPKKKHPFAPGVLAAPTLPSIASLKHMGKATGIGGAGEKHFFTDDDGKKWLLKVAAAKGGGAAEPFKAAAQTFFSKVGLAVKPSTVPIGPTEFAGKPATLQPWLGDNLKSLSGLSPSALTPAQKKDVADEHVLDWLMSQHDTHGGNLVKKADGSIVGIDKEQAFKYLLPNSKWTASTPEGDKLSTDYHPNAQYGEQPPYYNQFWGEFADGKNDFDPTVMKDAIAAIEAIPNDQYAKDLADYASLAFPNDAGKQSQLITKALDRKINIRSEFENFITAQYQKRTKKKGKFTYAGGWVPEGAVVTAPAATSQPIPAVVAPVQTSAPKSIPAADPGYTAPKASEVVAVASKLGISDGGVYYPALQALAQFGNPDLAKAALTSSGVSPDMAEKRVNYVHKKIKSAGGWPTLLAPSATVPGAAEPVIKSKVSEKVVLFQHPFASGPVGVIAPKMVTAAGVKLGEETKTKTPAGYPEPAPGKMWEVKPFSQFFGSPESGGYLYKAKSPKDKSGAKLDSSPYLLLKLSKLSEKDAIEAFKAVGVSPIVAAAGSTGEGVYNDKPFFDSGTHLCCIVKKEDWEKAKNANTKIAVQVDIPPPSIQSTDKFTATPAAGELEDVDVEANGNIAELKTIHTSKEIGYARGYMGDGKAVEHLSMTVQRNEDEKGTFYRVNFKLREPFWKKLKGYSEDKFRFNRVKYDPAKDSWVKHKTGNQSVDTFDARVWESEGSRLHIGTGSDKFCYKGFVSADVRLKSGETLEDGLRRTLAAAGGDELADTVLKPASKEDIELVGLSALYWSAAPQDADALSDSERTVGKMREKLKAKGYSDAELDSIRMETVALGYSAPVLPGRWKKLKEKYPVSHVGISGRGNVDAIVDQICGATIGITQRLLQGVEITGSNSTSADGDQKTGGGDYVYGNAVFENGEHTPSWGGGEVVMVFDPSELDRLDTFMHSGDHWGCCNPSNPSWGSSYKNRSTLESGLKYHAEIMFRRGINSRKLLKVRVEDKTVAEAIIAKLKKQGVTTINGMKPEELVVVKGSNSTFHSTYLKPAGY